MNRHIHILDSTLRDGGYCNDWEFGKKNIETIVTNLISANIDIIECGLITKTNVSDNRSRYSNIEDANELVTHKNNNSKFVLLMNYGDFDVDSLPEHAEDGIDGIRLAFHKKDMEGALEVAGKIKEKKYLVFMQPMVAMNYSSDEFVKLLNYANEIKPYAFYIVDSFGSMKPEDIKKFSSMANYILNKDIILGLHSHNNLQLAYSNAQLFVQEINNRELIVDSCIMGMGRGAGNLNTELFITYANDYYDCSYRSEPILKVIDEIISIFYQKKYWGYSLPNYLSATYGMHPNYGTYIADKNTLTISMMQELLSLVDPMKRNVFDKDYIENLYLTYMSVKEMEAEVDSRICDIFKNKQVLIIAPGKSIDEEETKIKKFIEDNKVITISVNFDYMAIDTDYVFLSNAKRSGNLSKSDSKKIIITSNVKLEKYHYIVDYCSLLCDEKDIRDNATMMLIKLLINSGVSKIYLAGVDGYSIDIESNYTHYSTELVTSIDYILKMNKGMNKALEKYSQITDIEFVTTKKNIGR